MTHYSDNPGSVRMDLYKPGGKWYATEELIMGEHYEGSIFDAVEAALVRTFGEKIAASYRQAYIIVVAEPYHLHAHPVTLIPEWMLRLVLLAEKERDDAKRKAQEERMKAIVGENPEGY